MYEQARKHLRAEHEMKNAAQLYMGLGYCAYALAYQQFQVPVASTKELAGEMEQEFQQARLIATVEVLEREEVLFLVDARVLA